LGVALAAVFVSIDWEGVIDAGKRLRDRMVDHEIFSVREIQVKAGEKVGGSEIVETAGLSQGMSIWRVDPQAIEKKIARHPWVKQVLVRREFPRRVVIEVEEREPKAIAALGKLYYVDRDGYIFKPVEPGERSDYPLLTGLKAQDLQYPAAYATRLRIKDALKLSDLIGKEPFALSEIRFLPRDGVVAYPVGYRLALTMGAGNWEDKIKRLRRVMTLWKGNEERLAALDVRFRDQVVARMRKS
ncbi:MAG TPA: FtsQ-type POTRA domain-containing protein, partial [Candidatus Binatia bacterium]|nr:FtsQ-type POTRA domain-containing protein [Candidatus Binatia bacterium]